MPVSDEEILQALERNPNRLAAILERANETDKERRARIEAEQAEAQDAEAERQAELEAMRENDPVSFVFQELPPTLDHDLAEAVAGAVEDLLDGPHQVYGDAPVDGRELHSLILKPPHKLPAALYEGRLPDAVNMIYGRLLNTSRQPTIEALAKFVWEARNWMKHHPPQYGTDREFTGQFGGPSVSAPTPPTHQNV